MFIIYNLLPKKTLRSPRSQRLKRRTCKIELAEVELRFKIPTWLETILAWPVVVYRRLRYGYSFRRIPLGDGKYSIVDCDDYHWLNRCRWFTHKTKNNSYYAYRVKELGKTVVMHRLVNKTPKGLICDHINHDALNNRSANLRSATHKQNCWNSRKRKTACSSKYKGICWNKARKRWTAKICANGKRKHIGYFKDEVEAAKAYDRAARKYHGQFAYTNFD